MVMKSCPFVALIFKKKNPKERIAASYDTRTYPYKKCMSSCHQSRALYNGNQ